MWRRIVTARSVHRFGGFYEIFLHRTLRSSLHLASRLSVMAIAFNMIFTGTFADLRPSASPNGCYVLAAELKALGRIARLSSGLIVNHSHWCAIRPSCRMVEVRRASQESQITQGALTRRSRETR